MVIFEIENNKNFKKDANILLNNILIKRKNYETTYLNKINNETRRIDLIQKEWRKDKETQNHFVSEFGDFGEALSKLLPWSYSRDILSILLIYTLSLLIDLNIFFVLILIVFYIVISFSVTGVKKEQIEKFMFDKKFILYELKGLCEYNLLDDIQKKWIDKDIENDDIEIIKRLVSTDSINELYSEGNIKYGSENFLYFIYELRKIYNDINV